MRKAHRKTKTRSVKEANRPGEKLPITRAQAMRLAQRHVLARIFKGARVQDGAEVRLGVYVRGNWAARDVWVVYKNSEELALKSSDVVLVSKRKGQVLYEGSAGDEG